MRVCAAFPFGVARLRPIRLSTSKEWAMRFPLRMFLVWDGRSFLGGSEPHLYPSRVDAEQAMYRASRNAGNTDQQTTFDIVYASFHDIGDAR